MPAVCRFYLKGYCRYGSDCRFEHPGETKTSKFSFKKALEESTTVSSKPSYSFARALEESVQQHNPYPFANQQPLYSSTPYNFNSGRDQQQQQIGFNNPYTQTGLFNQSYQQPFGGNNSFNNTFGNQTFGFANQTQDTTLTFSSIQNKSPFAPACVDEVDMRASGEGRADNIQLTEIELKAYQSDKFQFRLIPVRPPPRDLCF